MAYSDYGGRVFRNGERVEERCDAVLSTDGIKSTPGTWPGWTIPEGRSGGSYHALLGDGPIFVGLYKQTICTVSRLGEDVPPVEHLVDRIEGAVCEWNEALLNADTWRRADRPAVLEVDGHRIELRWTEEDNFYVYARLTQPDGTVWTGWSGYGVGAGLEEGDHGFDSDERDATLSEVFPVSCFEALSPEKGAEQ